VTESVVVSQKHFMSDDWLPCGGRPADDDHWLTAC
jgi:hypothetical protein